MAKTPIFREIALALALVILMPLATRAEVETTLAAVPVPASVPLDGARNFRDLGGYATVDGHHVKPGLLFRSEALSNLTESDYQKIDRLGLRSVIDLRSPAERVVRPTVWRASPVEVTLGSVKPAPTATPISNVPDARGALIAFYQTAPTVYAPEYRALFAQLLANKAPLLVHCTAGKDRTGVASALILSALGVSRSAILADYQRTEALASFDADIPKLKAWVGEENYAKMTPEARYSVWRADPAFIQSTFTELERRYGSVDNYLDKELGVGPKKIRRLRVLYTE